MKTLLLSLVAAFFFMVAPADASSGKKPHKTKPATGVSHPRPTTSHELHTGPRGGQYYINSHGKKTYVKH